MTILFIIAVVLAVLGTAADYVTTRNFLKVGIGEANPVTRWLLKRTSVVGATVVFDVTLVSLFSWFLWSIAGRGPVTVLLFVVGVLQLVVAMRNKDATDKVNRERLING